MAHPSRAIESPTRTMLRQYVYTLYTQAGYDYTDAEVKKRIEEHITMLMS